MLASAGPKVGHGSGVRGEEYLHLPGEAGTPPVVALSDVASQLAKLLEFLVGLHTFGDHLDAQGMPEIYRRPHDGQILGILIQILQEHPVQLQLVHGQIPQIRRRGVSHAEVVYGQPHSQILEPPEGLRARFNVLHQEALCYLQREAPRIQVGPPKDVLDLADEFGVAQLAGGDVHGYGQRGVPGKAFLPLPGTAAGLAQHPPADRDYQAGLLGDGDESRRDQQAVFRMSPPQKRLHPHDLAFWYGNQRLIEDRQLLLGGHQGSSEISFQLQAVFGPFVHIRVEHPEGPTLFLGPVHGGVGVPEEVLRRLLTGVAQADAYAGGGEQFSALQKERPLELCCYPLGHPHRHFGAIDVLDEHDELVAPEAGQAILRAQAALEALGDELEGRVPRLVAQRVVYHLELIEVREQYSHLPVLLTPGALEGPSQAVHEELTVGEVGQVVMEGPMLEPLFQGLALGKVVEDPLPVEAFARFVGEENSLLTDPYYRPVFGQKPVLLAEGLPTPRLEALVGGQYSLPVVGMEALGPQFFGLPLLGRISEHLLDLGAGVERRFRLVHRVYVGDCGYLFHQHTETSLSLSETLFGLLASRNVSGVDHVSLYAQFPGKVRAHRLQPAPGTVFVSEAILRRGLPLRV